MAVLIRVPALGIAIANITINKWFVKEGERVEQGQALLEALTDKITMEVPAEASGVVLKIFFQEDAKLKEGIPIAIIGEAGEDITDLLSKVGAELEKSGEGETTAASLPREDPQPVAKALPGKVLATPLVKRIAREKGVDLSLVTPTGPGGRVTKEDVLAFAEEKQALSIAPSPELVPVQETNEIEIIPLKGVRKVIAEHMVRSVHTSPHYTMGTQVDCTQLVALRNELKDEIKREHGVNLTFVTFVVKAMALAVKDVPIVNSSVRGENIIVNKVANVGVAIASGDLIYVPVIKRPIEKSLLEIALEVAEYTKLGRENKLNLDHFEGGTITVTNMGVADLDVEGGLSIINQPEVAILSMGRVKDIVVPVEGEIVIQTSMSIRFTYDHRVVMGVPGARYAERVRHYLEHAELLVA